MVTKDMTIGEVVKQYPDSVALLTEYGLHCIGCHVATWETLEEGLRVHGADDKTIAKLVDDINAKCANKN